MRLALGSCLAFVRFFMLSIGGCPRVWRIGAQASPSHEPLLSELGIQLAGPFGLAWGLMAGGRGFASHGGATLSRGWLCQGGSHWTSRAPTSTRDAVVSIFYATFCMINNILTYRYIIIHSKYFPNSDWLKAHV